MPPAWQNWLIQRLRLHGLVLNSQSVLTNDVTLYALACWVWDLFGDEFVFFFIVLAPGGANAKRPLLTCYIVMRITVNHFSTTGRCSGPAHYDVSIRQAARAAFVMSSFKIFSTQTFPRCGSTGYILPSRAMTQLFNCVNFVYRSVEVYLTFCSYLRVLVRIRNFYNGGRY